MDLLEWWNAPFALVFAFAVLWSIGSQFFGGDHGDGDADSEHDFGVEHHTAEVDVQHGPALFTQALYAVGFGRVPLSVFIGVFLFSWSLLGWASNIVWSVYIWDQPEVFFWFSLGLACVGGLVSAQLPILFIMVYVLRGRNHAQCRKVLGQTRKFFHTLFIEILTSIGVFHSQHCRSCGQTWYNTLQDYS